MLKAVMIQHGKGGTDYDADPEVAARAILNQTGLLHQSQGGLEFD
jgi:hypothetical protein